jgi:hypothetical protein
MSLQRKLDSTTFDTKTAQVTLLLIFAAALWLFEVSSWSFFVLVAFCRLLPIKIAVGVLALFSFAILPLDRLIPFDNCPSEHPMSLAEPDISRVEAISNQGECGFKSQVFELSYEDGREVTLDGWTKNNSFTYPPAASLFEAEFSGEAIYLVTENGRASVEKLQNATASNVKPLFEEAIIAYIEEGFFFNTASLDAEDFPLTGELRMVFRLGDTSESFNFPVQSLLQHFAFLVIAGFLCGNLKTLISFVAAVAAPYGVFIAALHSFIAVKSSLTTKYLFLAEALTIGSFFVVLGALAWISGGSKAQAFSSANISFPRKLLSITSIVLLPVLAVSESTNAGFLAFLVFDIGAFDAWFPEFGDSFWRQQVLLSYVLQTFFSWQFLAAISLYLMTGLLGRTNAWRASAPDAYLLVSAALVVYSIIFWFASIDRINEDYTAIFIALEIGALALMLCPLALITESVAPKLDQPNTYALRGRRSFLLVELFTFFLFFAYAPVSISELGQSFEANVGMETETKDIQSRLQTIEEKLEISREETVD